MKDTQNTQDTLYDMLPLFFSGEEKRDEDSCGENFFAMLFRGGQEALSLYNALNRSAYTDPGALCVRELQDALFLWVKDDNSFVIRTTISLFLYQSIDKHTLADKLLWNLCELMPDNDEEKISVPAFILFYNGTEKKYGWPVKDYFCEYEEAEEYDIPQMEVSILDITSGNNEDIMDRCKPLREYRIFAERLRGRAAGGLAIAPETVERVADECIRDGILADFFTQHAQSAPAVAQHDFNNASRAYFLGKLDRIRDDAWFLFELMENIKCI